MQYSLALAAALAASAAAQDASSSGGVNLVSLLPYLTSVWPSATYSAALANPSSFSVLVASEINAGQTPAWFTKLPVSIQTELHPVTGAASSSAALLSSSASITGSGTAISTGVMSNSANSSVPFRASTATPSMSSSAGGSSSTGSGSGSTTAASSSSTGSGSASSSPNAASMPTAIMGAGLAGVVGLVGALAL